MMMAPGRPRRDTTGGGLMMMPLVWLLLLVDFVAATQWTVTSYFALSVTTVTYSYSYYDLSSTVYTQTETLTIKPDATITAAALSTSSLTYSYDDLEVVKIWLPPSAVSPSDIQTTPGYTSYDDSERLYTYYVRPVAYTAPKSCPTPFTVTTSTTVQVPDALISKLTVTATSTSVYRYDDGDAYTHVTAYLDNTYWPSASDLSSAYLYTAYVLNCRNPGAKTTSTSRGSGSGRNSGGDSGSSGDSGGSGDSGDGGGDGDCDSEEGCGQIQTWGIVLAVVLPTIFLLGFLESFLWFSRLMTGKSTMRFGTACWLFLCCPIIFLTRGVPPRSTEDQEQLREQWKGMSAGKKMGLWVKLGLRHRYPVELLGDHPDYKPDGWSEKQQMRSEASNVSFVGQQQRQSQDQPQPIDKKATVQQQTPRRSSQRMPTIHEQPPVPQLSEQTSPSIVVSSVSDTPISDAPPQLPPPVQLSEQTSPSMIVSSVSDAPISDAPPQLPPPVQLSEQTSPSIVVSSVSDAPTSDAPPQLPQLPPPTANADDETRA